MTLIINIMGGPGVGKSTAAAKIFTQLKEKQFNVELVTEVAKEMVWEDRLPVLKDQLYIFAKQNRRLERLRDKVDFVVTDSPGILAIAYQVPDYYHSFTELVVDVHNSYNNINFVLPRHHQFDPKGRAHDEQASKDIDATIKNILETHNLPYFPLGTDIVSMHLAMDRILLGSK